MCDRPKAPPTRYDFEDLIGGEPILIETLLTVRWNQTEPPSESEKHWSVPGHKDEGILLAKKTDKEGERLVIGLRLQVETDHVREDV
jgi:hypothetical protein